jgi:hypothetical protein
MPKYLRSVERYSSSSESLRSLRSPFFVAAAADRYSSNSRSTNRGSPPLSSARHHPTKALIDEWKTDTCSVSTNLAQQLHLGEVS